jgi:hypothetical protein
MVSQGYGVISQTYERFSNITKPFHNIGESQINIGKRLIQDQIRPKASKNAAPDIKNGIF